MKRDIEKEALTHALAALDDGVGHDVWGPGPIGFKLWEKKHAKAATAFDLSAMNAVQVGKKGREEMIAFIRKTAPVLYEALSTDE